MGQRMLQLPKWLKIGCLCLVFGAVGSDSAFGDIVFSTGTINGGDVDNVLVGKGQEGMQIIGKVNGFDVLFTQPTSAVSLMTPSGGQASIQSKDGNGFTSLRTQLVDGSLFGKFEINSIFDMAGVQFKAVADDGTFAMFTSGNGQSRINAVGTDGTLFQYIDIIAMDSDYLIQEIKQVRIGGIQPAAVPEPSSWILLACVLSGGLIVHVVRRNRARSPAVIPLH